jgi:hypothetical protein
MTVPGICKESIFFDRLMASGFTLERLCVPWKQNLKDYKKS